MIKNEYANAYCEVLEILKYIPKKDFDKIPHNKINLFETYSSKDYEFKYDPNKTLDEQQVSRRTKAIIFILFRDYWANDEQRKKIETKQKYDRIKIEEEKKEKYKSDSIFINGKTSTVENVIEPVAMIEYKESLFARIIDKIKNIFNKY